MINILQLDYKLYFQILINKKEFREYNLSKDAIKIKQRNIH